VAPRPGEGAPLSSDGATPGGGDVHAPPGARGRWSPRGYLDLMHLLGMEPMHLLSMDAVHRMERCGLVWWRELHPTRGERRRVVGCGERPLCPRCATAVARREAGEAVALLEGMVKALGEGVIECWGVGWTFTMPKEFSLAVEEALLGGGKRFRELVNVLFEGVRSVLKEVHEEDGDIAGVAVLHLNGDESLVEPHVHIHVYVYPFARRGDGGWVPVRRWEEREVLEGARQLWKAVLERVFGAFEGEVDIHRQYFGEKGQAVHYLCYQLRPLLEGLWDGGWRRVTVEGARRIVGRVLALPRGFKRIRWFGWLTPGQRCEVLPGLGFREAEDEDEGERWQRVGGGVLLGWRQREDGGWDAVFRDWDGVLRTCPEERMEWWPPWGGRRRRWVWDGVGGSCLGPERVLQIVREVLAQVRNGASPRAGAGPDAPSGGGEVHAPPGAMG
jgi:ketosteroid isomerase-like protein